VTGSTRGFDPIATETISDDLAYAPTLLRTQADVVWQDAAGAHTLRLDTRATIGSAPESHVVVADRAVSRLHAELYTKDHAVWVRDLGSRNGTFVESVQISDAKVASGARVRVGATELLVSYGAAEAPVDLWPSESFGKLLGRSAAMRECFARLARIAGDDGTVLVQGETGTGKELVAQTIHDFSPRAGKPFVIVDCGALPENLLESELFGHVKGAFTGAKESRAGAFECAEGGTVFLDEIGELPLGMQPKLLRVLEARTVRRLGESRQRPVDIRIVSATHRDLRTMVNLGAFREDLYFRIAVLPLTVPPLRDRAGDVPLLAQSFLTDGATLSADLLGELARRPWVGNVRELRNFVARARVLGAADALASYGASPPAAARANESFPQIDPHEPFREVRARWLDHLEREYVRSLLSLHQGNISAVGKAAGLDRTYIYRLIRKHDL
jgi:two-component system, NtrC family, response regulator GlrR